MTVSTIAATSWLGRTRNCRSPSRNSRSEDPAAELEVGEPFLMSAPNGRAAQAGVRGEVTKAQETISDTHLRLYTTHTNARKIGIPTSGNSGTEAKRNPQRRSTWPTSSLPAIVCSVTPRPSP